MLAVMQAGGEPLCKMSALQFANRRLPETTQREAFTQRLSRSPRMTRMR
jgi:hypothetical protein